jgi:LysR family glycine cleavage system transcriptional activator
MRSRLPSLTAIKAFEATARHLSVTKAAAELFVTQSAVSRQIRALENELNTPLFYRGTRRLDMTPAGQSYFNTVAKVFDEIATATDTIRGPKPVSILKISVLPTISSHWLMPRLAGYSQAQPGSEIRIINSVDPVDFRSSEIDLAIRVGPLPGETFSHRHPRIEMVMVTDWNGIRSDPLFPDILTPVCSRTFADAHPGDLSIDKIARLPKIHVTTRRFAWPDWLGIWGVESLSDRSDSYFGHFFMALEAARAGRGLAIIPTILLRHYDGIGELFCPFPPSIESAGQYRILFKDNREQDPIIKPFRTWLLEQALLERRDWDNARNHPYELDNGHK